NAGNVAGVVADGRHKISEVAVTRIEPVAIEITQWNQARLFAQDLRINGCVGILGPNIRRIVDFVLKVDLVEAHFFRRARVVLAVNEAQFLERKRQERIAQGDGNGARTLERKV